MHFYIIDNKVIATEYPMPPKVLGAGLTVTQQEADAFLANTKEIVDGQLVDIIVPPPTLGDLKVQKKHALTNAFYTRLNSGVTVDGIDFSLSPEGRTGYVERGLLYLYAGKRDGDKVGAKNKHNSVVAMNYAQFKSRMVQVGVAYETLVQTLEARKAAVDAAQTENDLNAISEVFA